METVTEQLIKKNEFFSLSPESSRRCPADQKA